MVLTKQRIGPDYELKLKEDIIKQCKQFFYLGNLLTADRKYDSEINRETILSKVAFSKLKQYLTNKHITIKTKVNLLRTYKRFVFLYSCET